MRKVSDIKIALALCVILVLVSGGCSGTKEVVPSEDSLRTEEAMNVIRAIQSAYREKNREELANRIHPVIARRIMDELSFEAVELSISPWVVRIKESSTIIRSDWRGSWLYGSGEVKKRGIADFVFTGSPMKLVHINGDNPFTSRPADQEHGAGETDQGEPQGPERTPTADGDAESGVSAVQTVEEKDARVQQRPGPEPAAGSAETSGLQPLKRTRLLYMEDDRVPDGTVKTLQGAGRNKYIVQVGAWKNEHHAQSALEVVRGQHPEAVIVEEGGFHKIRIKKMVTRHEGMLTIGDLEDTFNFRPVLIGLDPPSDENRREMPDPTGTYNYKYFVRIGVWRTPEYAESALADLQKRYPDAVIVRENDLHKVGIPVISNRERADRLMNEIRGQMHLEPYLVEK